MMWVCNVLVSLLLLAAWVGAYLPPRPFLSRNVRYCYPHAASDADENARPNTNHMGEGEGHDCVDKEIQSIGALERMIEESEREQRLEMEIKKAEERAKKKKVMRKKADKEYEAYWERQKQKGLISNDKALYSSYYGLRRNETLEGKVTSGGSGPGEEWDYDVRPVSNRQYASTAVGLASALTAAVLAKKWSSISKFVSVTSEIRPLDERMIRRDFQLSALEGAAAAAVADGKALPVLPAVLKTLPVLGGAGVNPFAERTTVPFRGVTAVIFWRPTDVGSVRTMRLLAELERVLPRAVRCVAVLVPKYPDEAQMTSVSGLLLPGELPATCLVDSKLEAWRALGLGTWPTVVLAAKEKVVFALEGGRALTDVGGRAIGALASALGVATSGDMMSKWDIGMPIRTATTPSGRITDGGRTAKSLSNPTRLAVNFRTGRIYVADTGNHRILECELDLGGGDGHDVGPSVTGGAGTTLKAGAKLLVRRIFGSSEGEAGRAVAGCSAQALQLNRPMGLAVDVDGFLYVADSANDVVRRIDISDGATGGDTIVVVPANVDQDSSGVSYDFPTLKRLEVAVGATVSDMSKLSAEELSGRITAALKSGKLDDVPKVSVGQLLGRTRTLVNPTDVAVSDAFFYVSSPVSRQIWRVEGGGFSIRPVFGSGVNGKCNTHQTAARMSYASAGAFLSDSLRFSEPMGLSGSSGRVFCVDADACSIRSINLIEGYTQTIAGGGRGADEDIVGAVLSGFGDEEGSGNRAAMQYPTAAANFETVDNMLVCDTLNHRVREVFTRDAKARVRTLVGVGVAGGGGAPGNLMPLKEVRLSAPQGVFYDRSRKIVLVSDTGNNRILAIDKSSGTAVALSVTFD